MGGVQLWNWVQHHRWLSVVFLAVLVIGTAGGTCWAVFFRTVASPVSLRDALRMYHRERADSSGRPDAGAAAGTALATSSSSNAVLVPGVFSYATSGGEGLNLVGVSRSFPVTTEMVVAPPSGSCSRVDWVPIVQHTETTVVCRAAHHALSISELMSHETIGGTTTTTVITCPPTTYLVPPSATPGSQWAATCHQVSPSEQVTMAGVVLNAVPMKIRGESVSTLHVRLSFDFVGLDRGTSPVDFWISTGRGLIVREQEVAHITQQGWHYTEQMDSRLTSLAPAAD
jgi:hypothetical protein